MIRKKIELREERDFGQKFNAVFTFVQTNFKPFIKVMALTVGPLALVGGFFFGLFYSKLFGGVFSNLLGDTSLVSAGGIGTGNMSWIAEMLVSYLFLGLASLWMIIAVYAFMVEYDNGNENITIEAVWKRGKNKIWPSIGFGFLVVLAMIFFVVMIFVFPGNNVFGIVMKSLFVYTAIFYIMITLSLVVPNMVIEDAGLFESIGRSFTLIWGKWWSTFGLLMVMSLIANTATMIFAIPFYIAWIVTLLTQTTVGETLTVISSCIMFLGSFLMMTLPALAVGFQYFNLVERKDGTGLLKKIDQLGKQDNING